MTPALGQRAGQSDFWHRRFGKVAALTPGGERHEFRLTPWSDDPVQDTTGEALIFAMSRPDNSGRRCRCPRAASHLCHSPWLGYNRVRAHRKRQSLPSYGLCGDGRAGEILGSKIAQCLRASGRISVTGYWNGCWAICGRKICCTHKPKWTSRPARCWRAIIINRISRPHRVS